jgi:hypothetical protein
MIGNAFVRAQRAILLLRKEIKVEAKRLLDTWPTQSRGPTRRS